MKPTVAQTLDAESLTALRNDLAERGIRYLIPSYVDMHGIPKTKIVPVDYLEQMLRGSELFTGAALDGVPQNLADDEVASVPDPASLIQLPWRDNCGWFSSDLWYQGKPFEPCNRGILKRVLSKASDMGFTVNCGIEAEFFVFKENEVEPTPLSSRPHLAKPAYDAVRLLDNLDLWLEETADAMTNLGWGLYSFDHEDGIGQFELDFMYSDALTMADRFTFLRVMVHEYARKHDCFASFMPKPFADRTGSGAHLNVSLADKETGINLFDVDGVDNHGLGLSPLGYQFVAGIMNHLPAIVALCAPTVNSYKRMVAKGSMSGYTWAPCFTSWGGNNRSNTLRIPSDGGRVELRAADSACNPYLGIALLVAAGLEGIEQGITPTPPNRINLYECSEDTRAAQGVNWLPRNLEQAITALEADPLSKQVMGPAMLASWVSTKKEEWRSYNQHVSQWERDHYLRLF